MSYTFELNNERKDSVIVNRKPAAKVVEIFSALAGGKDMAPFGKDADKVAKAIMELNSRAAMGDSKAAAELNTIRRVAMNPVVLQEIKLLSLFGPYTALGYEESCEVEIPEYANVTANMQAAGQDVEFPVVRMKRVPIATHVISGGYAVDYRKASLGDMSKENELQEQVRIQIRNRAAKYVVDTVYTAIKNAAGVKYIVEDAGLTKSNFDSALIDIRRHGKPFVTGDYALVSQINGFVGYQGTTPVVTGISDAVMEEIRSTGLLGMYNGTAIRELPNAYDLTTLTPDGKNFETMLPQGLGFALPAGVQSPIRTVTRGGLTSCTGNDVTTGTIMTRFDLEVGALVAPGHEYKVGLLHDLNLDDLR